MTLKTYKKILLIGIAVLIILFCLFGESNYKIPVYTMLIFGIIVIISLVLTLIANSDDIQPREKWNKNIIKYKSIDSDFDKIYSSIYNENIKKIRKYKNKSMVTEVIFKILFFILFNFHFVYFMLSMIYDENFFASLLLKSNNILVFIVEMVILSFAYEKAYKYREIYVNIYKEKVIKKLIEAIDKNLIYQNTDNNNLEKYFKEADFYKTSDSAFFSNDYINGNVNGINIQISDAKLGKDQLKISYKGLFSFCKINKKIPFEIRITNNKIESMVKGSKVNLDSLEFEKYFDVFCEYNIFAVRLLTHDVMEEMIAFYEKIGLDFEIVIREDNIYIKFDVQDVFEPEVFRNTMNKNTLWIFYSIIKFAVTFTQKMNKILDEFDV